MRCSIKLQMLVAILFGGTLGSIGTYLGIKDDPPRADVAEHHSETEIDEQVSDDPFAETEEDQDESLGEEDWIDRLSKLSGKWMSVDGQQTAELDLRTLRFGPTTDWPDLSNRYFLIGEEMQFMTNSGYYDFISWKPDQIRVIKEDLVSGDLTAFTLYREDSPHARSREPLTDKNPPEKIQSLLDLIPTIKKGEKKESVMNRFSLSEDEALEPLAGEQGLGESDWIYGLGIDNEWMLRLGYLSKSPDAKENEMVLVRFQIIRGYIDDVKAGRDDTFKLVYPYFLDGKIITAPKSNQ